MKNFLIISYFFPPCNLTASQRPFSWAKSLHEYGYEPVVITRNWDHEIASYLDISRDSGDNDRLTDYGTYKVWHMKFRGTIRDRLFVKHGSENNELIRKTLSFLELIFQNFFVWHLGYFNIYQKAREILKNDVTIRKIIISANPYVTFHFGYLLKKEFPRVEWVADYRDDWTTTGIIAEQSFLRKMIYHLEQKSEKKWVSTASCITSVSDFYAQKLSSFLKKPGYVIANGYADDLSSEIPVADPSKFVITYSGTLYPMQPVEIFMDAFIILSSKYHGKIRVLLQFPGLSIDTHQTQRITQYLKGFEEDVFITERVPRERSLELQRNSNLLLLIGQKVKGNIASKLYEYVGNRKQILFLYNDHDTMEKVLRECGLGIFCETSDEVVQAVSTLIDSFIKKPEFIPLGNEEVIKKYSRRNQVKKLAEILDAL